MKHVTDEQEVLEALHDGSNVFITGSAGSGKTYLASEFAKTAEGVALTATTGAAALNLGGETIHRLLKLGICTRDFQAERIIGRWLNCNRSGKPWDKNAWDTLSKIKTIIIDEVSMLRRDQFELIDIVLSAVKDNHLPFGGVQMVLVGDFFQLPPVVTPSDASRYPDLKQPFCFQSPLWNQANFRSFNLKTNYRQGDGEFLDALEQIRIGNLTDDARKLLESRYKAKLEIPFEPVKLFSLKGNVNSENIACLKKLPGDKILSTAEFYGKEYDIGVLKKECPAEEKLYFGVGAQVIMLTNTDRWVNGTMGIIKEINPLKIKLSTGETIVAAQHKWERVNYTVDKDKKVASKVVAEMHQYPFKLGYASTIHKSQGLTLDYVDIDLSNCFAAGQAYVALSRAKTLEGLTLRGWNSDSIKADLRVIDFYKYR